MTKGFTVNPPNKTRRTFAITPYHRDTEGKKIYGKQLKNEALLSLNDNLKNGLIGLEQARLEIKNIILPSLKAHTGIVEKTNFNRLVGKQNLRAINKYWGDSYVGKDLVYPEKARAEIIKAISYIEPLSLITSSKKELQSKLDAVLKGSRHKRYGCRINQLLTFLGRGFILHLKRPEPASVHYLTWSELQTVLPHITNPVIQDIATVLFCTGVRLGEAFALNARDLKPDNSIYIYRQLDSELRTREIKNRKPHKTILLKEGREAFLRWVAVPDKESYRHRVQHPIILAARKAFKDKARQISPHDLRHSYVVHLLGLGVPLDKVAKLIGDTIKTTEQYYAGFVVSSNEIDFINQIIDKG